VRALVTGATGFIGFHVAGALLRKGLQVRAIARRGSDSKALASLGAEVVAGDVRDYDSLFSALNGCNVLYHLAADYRLWVPDPATMYEINVRGTRNVMEAALRRGTERVVYTSTVGVLRVGLDRIPSNEETPVSFSDMVGDYKKSKFLAEQEVHGFIEKGLPVVIVNPSTPVGAVDIKPTPTGKMIVDFLKGRMPAYLDTGLNFVDVADVAEGHLLAAELGRAGQRYILGNRNMTLREFFECLGRVSGRRPPRVRLPYLPVLIAAYCDEAISRLVAGRRPAIPLSGVKMAKYFMYFDPSKAVRELGMPQSPVEGALAKAVAWFLENGYVKTAA
jgi:dihydroflavonol-4-reductase